MALLLLLLPYEGILPCLAGTVAVVRPATATAAAAGPALPMARRTATGSGRRAEDNEIGRRPKLNCISAGPAVHARDAPKDPTPPPKPKAQAVAAVAKPKIAATAVASAKPAAAAPPPPPPPPPPEEPPPPPTSTFEPSKTDVRKKCKEIWGKDWNDAGMVPDDVLEARKLVAAAELGGPQVDESTRTLADTKTASAGHT